MKRYLFAAPLLTLLPGCSATRTITVTPPAYSGEKIPLSVAYTPSAGPEGHAFIYSNGACPGKNTVADAGSLDAAVKTLLAGPFERVLPPKQAGADFFAEASVHYADIPLAYRMYGDGKSIITPQLHFWLTYAPTGDILYDSRHEVLTHAEFSTTLTAILSLFLPPISYYCAASTASRRIPVIRASIDKALNATLRDLSEKLPELRAFPIRMAKVAADEKAGDAAAAAGRAQEAFDKYLAAMRGLPPGHKYFYGLRGKFLPFVAKAEPPELPEEARREFYAGTGKSQTATGPHDGAAAAGMLAKAAELAPWWPEAYFNLGVAHEIAQQYKAAAAAFGMFLIAKPDAKDAEEVRKRMYALEGRGR